MNIMNICCIGAGYVGGPTMAIIAKFCPNIKVTVVDTDQEKINAWNTNNLPVYEPGLLEIIQKTRNKNLFFSTNIEESIKNSKIIFICVGTPTKEYGIGQGEASDLTYIENCAHRIGAILKENHSNKDQKIIVEKSTVPVKTANIIKNIINCYNINMNVEILSNPEFLAEGSAIKDLENPDRVLIGGNYKNIEGKQAMETLVNIYKKWVDKNKIITTNIWSSELSKLTANAFLAQRISSINAISELCEYTGANINEIEKSIGSDKRIGKYFLKASIGFGGSCFQKDIYNLIYICNYYGLKKIANYWKNVIEINNYQKLRFVTKVIHQLNNTLKNKKISILGFSFKKDTNDTREAPSIFLVKKLIQEKVQKISIYDPKVTKDSIYKTLNLEDKDNNILDIQDNVYEATKSSHAIIIATEWDIFKDLDYTKIYNEMKKPAYLFDGRNILNLDQIKSLGFKAFGVGIS